MICYDAEASNRVHQVWPPSCFDSGSSGKRRLNEGSLTLLLSPPLFDVSSLLNLYIIFLFNIMCHIRPNMLEMLVLHSVKTCSWRYSLNLNLQWSCYFNCFLGDSYLIGYSGRLASVFSCLYAQDKKNRFYVVSALTNTNVDLKGRLCILFIFLLDCFMKDTI